MKRLSACRLAAIMVLLLAAAGWLQTLGPSKQGSHLGLLTLGITPLRQTRACALCTPVRKKTPIYAPVPHYLGGPKRIILMRHADKTEDRNDDDLSEAGWDRAQHLATYIPATFGKPDIIIATARSKHSDRPRDTVKPLAELYGLTIQSYFGRDEFAELVDELFNDPDFKNKTVVICWHHGELPALSALLGASPGSYPDPWPASSYNLIIDLRYDPFWGTPPKVARVIEPF